MTIERRKRGRPRKIARTLEEQENDVIQKWLDFAPMTLEEAALGLWMHEGRKTEKPLSKMRIIQIEASAMKKLRDGLKKYGITSFDDVYDPRFRRNAEIQDRVDGDRHES